MNKKYREVACVEKLPINIQVAQKSFSTAIVRDVENSPVLHTLQILLSTLHAFDGLVARIVWDGSSCREQGISQHHFAEIAVHRCRG